METSGVPVYPIPELESTNELIVPNPETIAVAAAPIKSSWDMICIVPWPS